MKCQSCKTKTHIFGIHDENKLYRLTFSWSLAELIIRNDENLKISQFKFKKTGKILEPGELSSNGLYGIFSSLKRSSDLVLRICMDPETARMYTENDDSRRIEEIILTQA